MEILKTSDIRFLVVDIFKEVIKTNSQTDKIEKVIDNLETLISMLLTISQAEVNPNALLNQIRNELWAKYDLPNDSKLLQKDPFLSRYLAFLNEYKNLLNSLAGTLVGSILVRKPKFILNIGNEGNI